MTLQYILSQQCFWEVYASIHRSKLCCAALKKFSGYGRLLSQISYIRAKDLPLQELRRYGCILRTFSPRHRAAKEENALQPCIVTPHKEAEAMHSEFAAMLRQGGEDDLAELYRLRLQAEVWESAADQFFADLHIRPGSRVIDLCCGAMGVLEPLSRAVGEHGTVIGVESNPIRLNAARAFIEDAHLSNVDILKGTAVATGLPSGQFDLVHCRFLFAPTGHPDLILSEMLRLLRPGGYIAIQEPDGSCWNFTPGSASWMRLKTAIFGAIRAGGGDFNAGLHTFGMLRAAGMGEVSQRNACLACHGPDPYKQLPLQFANWLRPQIVDRMLMSEDRLEECLEDAITIAADPSTVMTTFLVTQVAARKT